MGAFAVPLLIASTAASAGMSVLGGIQAQKAGKAEAKMLERARADEQLAGRQRAVAIQRELRATLAGQKALMASRGLMVGDTGTPATIDAATRRAAGMDLLTDAVNTDSRMRTLAFQASQARTAGNAAFASGLVSAGTTLAGGALGLHQIGAFSGSRVSGLGQATKKIGAVKMAQPRSLFPAGLF